MEAKKRRVDVALLQEPYVGSQGRVRDHRGVRIFQGINGQGAVIKSAIAVFNDGWVVTPCPSLTTTNITVVKIYTGIRNLVVVSFYFEPDKPIGPYLEQLGKVVETLGSRGILIGGDTNAKSVWWGSVGTDARGEEVLGMLGEWGLQLLNDGQTPTFETVRGGKLLTSHIDITACSEDIIGLISDWKVDDTMASSDHNAITFVIKKSKDKYTQAKSKTTRKYNTNKANWTYFNEKLEELIENNNLTNTEIRNIKEKTKLDEVINKYTEVVTEASNSAIPLIKIKNSMNLPWWSEKLAKMKQGVATRRRRIRCAAPVRRAKVVREYLESKELYENEAKKAQIDSWKEFCKKQTKETIWNGVYRMIGKVSVKKEDLPLIYRGQTLSEEESAKHLAENFYPEDKSEEDNAEHQAIRKAADRINGGQDDDYQDPPFTVHEVLTAAESFNPKKAPGADGLTADICKQAIQKNPKLYLSLANRCLQLGHFPTIWKEATVVVLRKPGKEDYTDVKSYRPIGLLPVMGKILEKMVVGRVKWYLLPRMSTRQFGFMPQRGTEDSLYTLVNYIRDRLKEKTIVTAISLDIEGAFDSAWWPAIRVRLSEEECPKNLRRMVDSYFESRTVRVRFAGREHLKGTTKGCVQGSIGGPIFWNLLLDPLLRELDRRGVYCQAFADDIILVFDGETANIQRRANEVLSYVRDWGVRNKLKFAPHKTKAMVITRRLKYDSPILHMGGVDIDLTNELKVLGLIIDNKLTFNRHVAEISKKAIGFYRRLSRVAKVHWGLNPEILRTLYNAVVEPIMLYAASAWAPATRKKCVRRRLNSVQRGFVQRMTKAYRTVSLNSTLLLAGVLPLDIRVREAAMLYETKRGHSQAVVGDRGMERPVAFANLDHPARRKRWEYRSLTDGAELESHIRECPSIFTDGSKIEGRVGAALSIWEGTGEIKTKKLKLGSYCTVYQAELLALLKATEEVLSGGAATYNIFCDARSALDVIASGESLHPLAFKITKNLKTITERNQEIRLFWIKAHIGLEGNERADVLAKEAALSLKCKPHYDRCPVSFAKRTIRQGSVDEWDLRYTTESTASVTKIFFPNVKSSYSIIRRLEVDSTLTQVFTGHGGLSQYLHRFRCKESPACVCDPVNQESIVHVLIECPVHAKERFDTEQHIDLNIEVRNLPLILADKKNRSKFIEYCKKVIRIVINRNKQ